jgi:hypothetical protein
MLLLPFAARPAVVELPAMATLPPTAAEVLADTDGKPTGAFFLLSRKLFRGISRISRCRHSHSPRSEVMARFVSITTHQTTEAGMPDLHMVKIACQMYNVDEKSRHFFARPTTSSMNVEQRKALSIHVDTVSQPVKEWTLM